jgi:hypothetical protein
VFLKRPDEDATALQINLQDFMEDTGIDAVVVSKLRRSDHDELPDIVDNLADIVGNASGGI